MICVINSELTQWAAVRTCVGVSRPPPQKVEVPSTRFAFTTANQTGTSSLDTFVPPVKYGMMSNTMEDTDAEALRTMSLDTRISTAMQRAVEHRVIAPIGPRGWSRSNGVTDHDLDRVCVLLMARCRNAVYVNAASFSYTASQMHDTLIDACVPAISHRLRHDPACELLLVAPISFAEVCGLSSTLSIRGWIARDASGDMVLCVDEADAARISHRVLDRFAASVCGDSRAILVKAASLALVRQSLFEIAQVAHVTGTMSITATIDILALCLKASGGAAPPDWEAACRTLSHWDIPVRPHLLGFRV